MIPFKKHYLTEENKNQNQKQTKNPQPIKGLVKIWASEMEKVW